MNDLLLPFVFGVSFGCLVSKPSAGTFLALAVVAVFCGVWAVTHDDG